MIVKSISEKDRYSTIKTLVPIMYIFIQTNDMMQFQRNIVYLEMLKTLLLHNCTLFSTVDDQGVLYDPDCAYELWAKILLFVYFTVLYLTRFFKEVQHDLEVQQHWKSYAA